MLVTDPEIPELQTVPLAHDSRVTIVSGGAERVDSVLSGLSEIANRAAVDTAVLVHDAARPLVRRSDVLNLFATVADARERGQADGGLLACEVTDTIKSDATGPGVRNVPDQSVPVITGTVPRDGLWRAMTPQLFQVEQLHEALQLATGSASAADYQFAVTDESSAMEKAGYRVLLVKGASDNLKITLPQDLPLAEALLAYQQ